MKMVIRLVMFISVFVLLAGCSGEEQQTSNENILESEVLEMGTDNQEVFEQEVLNQETSDAEVSELEAFEQQMYDPEYSGQETIESEMLEMENPGQENFEEEIVQYKAEEYGEIQEYGGEFYYDEETKGFYYHMEMFFLGSDFLYTMNDTLQEFYDGYLWQYQETENWYLEQGPEEVPEGRVPYSELLFLGIQHIDNDYVSLLFNDVTYMGGAHPYSMFDAITIDRCTGEEVTASRILGESDTEILEKVSDLMGLDGVADWESIDFYLQDGKIVFFYRMSGYWEDVVLGR